MNRNRWLIAVGIVSFSVIIIGGIVLTRMRVTAAPGQPIDFSHQRHSLAGVQCLYCHPNAMRSDIAGLPSVEKCIGCHQTIATDRPQIRRVFEYWSEGTDIPWNRVEDQPDFVFFSHQPHLSSGLNCESCHGDVGQMDLVHTVVDMDMGWCLDCHQNQPPKKVARLEDCVACHK